MNKLFVAFWLSLALLVLFASGDDDRGADAVRAYGFRDVKIGDRYLLAYRRWTAVNPNGRRVTGLVSCFAFKCEVQAQKEIP